MPERRRAAVDHYFTHGRCVRRTIRALGYPSHEVLARWIDELEPGRHRLRRTPVEEETRRKAVARYACGEATSRRIGEELGVRADVVRNWKCTMLTHDDKEHEMCDGNAGHKPRPERVHRCREREALVSPLAVLRAERLHLEIEVEAIRCTTDLLGKGTGADSDNPANSEKTRLVLHLTGTFAMRPRNPWDPVQAMPQHVLPQRQTSERAEQGHVAARTRPGHARAKPRTLQLPQDMAHAARPGHPEVRQTRHEAHAWYGIRPKRKSRRCYNSHTGGHTPVPANLVNRRFHTQAPNRLWPRTSPNSISTPAKSTPAPSSTATTACPSPGASAPSNGRTGQQHARASTRHPQNGEHPVFHSDRGSHHC